jgi:hypothetical protein
VPEPGAPLGESWSSIVPKIDKVPSRLSITSIRRCCGGQSEIARALYLPEAASIRAREGLHAVVVGVTRDVGDDIAVTEEELSEV